MGALGIEGAINILLLVCTCHHDVHVSGRELNSVFMQDLGQKVMVLTTNKASCHEVAN